MPTFTVHAPPPKSGASTDPERFVFVRDGFHGWAFLLAPLWLLLHRLWLAFAGYVVLSVVIGLTLRLFGISRIADFFIALLIAILVGLEAATLWRWTLARRGWTQLGFAVGDDAEEAERRFFAAWTAKKPAAPMQRTPATASPAVWRAQPHTDVIGLFPEPGGNP